MSCLMFTKANLVTLKSVEILLWEQYRVFFPLQSSRSVIPCGVCRKMKGGGVNYTPDSHYIVHIFHHSLILL